MGFRETVRDILDEQTFVPLPVSTCVHVCESLCVTHHSFDVAGICFCLVFGEGAWSPLGGWDRSVCYERFRNGYGWINVSMKGGEPCLSRDDRISKLSSRFKVRLSRCHITGYSLACQTLDIMSLSCDWVPFRFAVVVLSTRRDELQE